MRKVDRVVISKLIDELWIATTCRDGDDDSCPAYLACRARHDENMLGGTECAAILRTWAYDTAREDMTNAMKQEDMCVCLIDNHHGVYIPQLFAEYNRAEGNWWKMFNLPVDTHEDAFQADLLAGPDNEHYWDAWTTVLDTAWYEDPETGLVWRLYQDDDLFMVVDGYWERLEEEGQL